MCEEFVCGFGTDARERLEDECLLFGKGCWFRWLERKSRRFSEGKSGDVVCGFFFISCKDIGYFEGECAGKEEALEGFFGEDVLPGAFNDEEGLFFGEIRELGEDAFVDDGGLEIAPGFAFDDDAFHDIIANRELVPVYFEAVFNELTGNERVFFTVVYLDGFLWFCGRFFFCGEGVVEHYASFFIQRPIMFAI